VIPQTVIGLFLKILKHLFGGISFLKLGIEILNVEDFLFACYFKRLLKALELLIDWNGLLICLYLVVYDKVRGVIISQLHRLNFIAQERLLNRF
jgi:hypothetical protein